MRQETHPLQHSVVEIIVALHRIFRATYDNVCWSHWPLVESSSNHSGLPKFQALPTTRTSAMCITQFCWHGWFEICHAGNFESVVLMHFNHFMNPSILSLDRTWREDVAPTVGISREKIVSMEWPRASCKYDRQTNKSNQETENRAPVQQTHYEPS